jgi:hypothetical protein
MTVNNHMKKSILLLILSASFVGAQSTNTITVTNIHTDVVTVLQTNVVTITNSTAIINPAQSPAFVRADVVVKGHFILPSQAGGSLLQTYGYIPKGVITLEGTNVVLSGICRVPIPVSVADAMIPAPNGISYSNLQPGGVFYSSEIGFEGDVTLKQ